MKHFAVIGYPIEHSRSPEIYNALFLKHGIDADFTKIAVKTDDLPEINEITRRLSGFAVTMPLKKTIIPYLDGMDDVAKECGSVNIVEVRDGKRIGHNTDGDGLVDALKAKGFDPKGKRACILGRGGAAMSAACALERSGCDITLLVRSIKEGTRFRTELLSEKPSKAELFINAAPLGMKGREDFKSFAFLDEMEPDAVLDMVYRNDGITNLISAAEERGIKAFDGNAMLYMQALRAFKIFTGIEA